MLLFLPVSELDRKPDTVLKDVKKVLLQYPDTTVDVSPQRRSVHLDFPAHDLQLDIVPAVAESGLDEVLKVPDRPQAEWIDSDPLGYAKRLSALNQEHGGKVVHLVKLIKAWREAQIKRRRPKSYVLEVLVLYAVEQEKVALVGKTWDEILYDFFHHIEVKYQKLMDEGSESPRIPDPQVGTYITKGWERAHFETFMRRIRECSSRAKRALDSDLEKAISLWQAIFGDLWPSSDEVQKAAMAEAERIQPGVALVGATGDVTGTGSGTPSQPTRFHGA